MIGAYYQCFRQIKSASEMLASFRKYYPYSSIVMVCDGGDPKHELIAQQYNATFYYETENLGYPGNGGMSKNKSLYCWIERFLKYSSQIKDEWFMLMEDDVFVIRKVNPDFLNSDVIGISYVMFLPKFISDYLRIVRDDLINTPEDLPFTGFGGTIFKTSFIKSLYAKKREVEQEVYNFEQICRENDRKDLIASDVLLSYLVYAFGGSTSLNPEHTEAYYSDALLEVVQGKIAIINNFKYFYE